VHIVVDGHRKSSFFLTLHDLLLWAFGHLPKKSPSRCALPALTSSFLHAYGMLASSISNLIWTLLVLGLVGCHMEDFRKTFWRRFMQDVGQPSGQMRPCCRQNRSAPRLRNHSCSPRNPHTLRSHSHSPIQPSKARVRTLDRRCSYSSIYWRLSSQIHRSQSWRHR